MEFPAHDPTSAELVAAALPILARLQVATLARKMPTIPGNRHAPLTADRVKILQQRVIHGHTLLPPRQEPGTRPLGYQQAEAACLATLRRGAADELALFLMQRDSDDEVWKLAAVTNTFLGCPPVQPLVTQTLGDAGRLIIGGVAAVSQIAAIRVTLADRTVREDRVAAGSFLIFIELRTPGRWSRPVTVDILDSAGGVIGSGKSWVRPYEPPPMGD